jgi:hypothetical protein
MKYFADQELKKHHIRCGEIHFLLMKDALAGCFYCLSVFATKEVRKTEGWCPKCGIDSVLVDDGVNEFTPELFSALKYKYFEEYPESGIKPDSPELDALYNEYILKFRKSLEDAQAGS